jgi:hypothetical protein
MVAIMTWLLYVTNDQGCAPFVVRGLPPFPSSRLITGFVARVTRRVQLVEQEIGFQGP